MLTIVVSIAYTVYKTHGACDGTLLVNIIKLARYIWDWENQFSIAALLRDGDIVLYFP